METESVDAKVTRYETALQEIVSTLWTQAVREQDRRHAEGILAPQGGSLQLDLAQLALGALYPRASCA